MDIFEKVKLKYKRRKILSIIMMASAVATTILTIVFVFVETVETPPFWNQYHVWSSGVAVVLLAGGIIMYLSSKFALKDIETAVDKSNPDEREQYIMEKSSAKTLKIHNYIIFPLVFIVSGILLMLEIINFVAWLIIISNFLALIITHIAVKFIENKKH